jgi:hypothetical protein
VLDIETSGQVKLTQPARLSSSKRSKTQRMGEFVGPRPLQRMLVEVSPRPLEKQLTLGLDAPESAEIQTSSRENPVLNFTLLVDSERKVTGARIVRTLLEPSRVAAKTGENALNEEMAAAARLK